MSSSPQQQKRGGDDENSPSALLWSPKQSTSTTEAGEGDSRKSNSLVLPIETFTASLSSSSRNIISSPLHNETAPLQPATRPNSFPSPPPPPLLGSSFNNNSAADHHLHDEGPPIVEGDCVKDADIVAQVLNQMYPGISDHVRGTGSSRDDEGGKASPGETLQIGCFVDDVVPPLRDSQSPGTHVNTGGGLPLSPRLTIIGGNHSIRRLPRNESLVSNGSHNGAGGGVAEAGTTRLRSSQISRRFSVLSERSSAAVSPSLALDQAGGRASGLTLSPSLRPLSPQGSSFRSGSAQNVVLHLPTMNNPLLNDSNCFGGESEEAMGESVDETPGRQVEFLNGPLSSSTMPSRLSTCRYQSLGQMSDASSGGGVLSPSNQQQQQRENHHVITSSVTPSQLVKPKVVRR